MPHAHVPEVDLVFVHGWCCDATLLAPLAEHFTPRHRVLLPELPAHGQDPREPEPVTIADYAADITRVCRGAGLDRPVLVGHSMGGLVALQALADAGSGPDGYAGAVLLDPAPIANARARQFWASAAQQVGTDTDGSWRRRFVDGLFLPHDTVGRDEVAAVMSGANPRSAAVAAQAMADYDGAAALARLTGPVLVLHAATVERGLERHVSDRALLTTGQTVGAGHFHHLQVPDQVVPMIRRWLAVTPGLTTTSA